MISKLSLWRYRLTPDYQQITTILTTMVSILTTILVQVTMGTTAAESMNASANIFLGQSEAPLMIRPYLKVIIVVVIIFAIIVLKILYLLWSDPTSRLIYHHQWTLSVWGVNIIVVIIISVTIPNQDMTKSEIHAVMTGGFATIAGSVLAAYIRFDLTITSCVFGANIKFNSWVKLKFFVSPLVIIHNILKPKQSLKIFLIL